MSAAPDKSQGASPKPWLSVIMPIYNGAETLPDTLASLEGQTEGLEILAINQGSADNSRSLLERASQRFPLRIIDNPHSSGWTENTNLGFAEAQADLVTMLHQDDVWTPDRTAILKAMAEADDSVDLWLHAGSLIDLSGRRLGRMAPPFGRNTRRVTSEEALSTLFVQNTVALPAAMMRRSAVMEMGLDTSLWYTADWDLWLRLADKGIYWNPTEAASFRIHAGSLTVTGARDKTDLRAQLAAPGQTHASRLPRDSRAHVQRLANVSIEINLALAAALTGQKNKLLPAILKMLSLGLNLPEFLSKSQLRARLMPRMRLALRGRFTPAPIKASVPDTMR
ncbi:glycosyltransferase family 2 protein [Litoreibacter roseus]|uniref:Glycosyltransferase 2-like domain-containing protein n=1 Tax=Litoreibacter roseus TaxID=2601869 RepID=A0A6N6JJH6_9RHOB|nr:glycosyltransferase family 2 protein [Litoreibacter roseus]GFE66215.1 hypothetical protein KIN_32890 [Litoreibacter roseus]